RDAGMYLSRAALHQCLRAQNDGAAGIDHVIDHNAGSSSYVADDFHDFYLVGFGAAFGDDGDGGAEVLGEGAGAGDAADVRGDDDGSAVVDSAMEEVVGDEGAGVEVIGRDIEEALDLAGVEVYAEDAVG